MNNVTDEERENEELKSKHARVALIRFTSYNSLIARLTYDAMEVWRKLDKEGYTANEATELSYRLGVLQRYRLERDYPPYAGPNYTL